MSARTLLAVLLLTFACGRSSTESASAQGSGSAAGSVDPGGMIAMMAEYGEKTLPILVRFSGDCDTLAKDLLTLEPLAQKIRAGGAELERMSEAERTAHRDRVKTAGDAVLAKIDAQLKALGATRDDLERQEAAMKQQCAGNAAFKDANERVGLKKKR